MYLGSWKTPSASSLDWKQHRNCHFDFPGAFVWWARRLGKIDRMSGWLDQTGAEGKCQAVSIKINVTISIVVAYRITVPGRRLVGWHIWYAYVMSWPYLPIWELQANKHHHHYHYCYYCYCCCCYCYCYRYCCNLCCSSYYYNHYYHYQ